MVDKIRNFVEDHPLVRDVALAAVAAFVGVLYGSEGKIDKAVLGAAVYAAVRAAIGLLYLKLSAR